jgi:hypothetical protein
MAAARAERSGAVLAVLVGLVGLAVACVLMGAIASAVVGEASPTTPGESVADIPAEYLAAYRTAAARLELGADGWSYLAAIGKVESDHGRSKAPGVSSGQNAYGCCAGPMQIHNGFGSGGGTWGAYKTDGDGDGRLDIYDPDDAIATAARYLRASGAPADWHRAIFAYNHAGWYVDEVERQAAEYRRAAVSEPPPLTNQPPSGSGWLAEVPGFPGERCDARIVPDVVALVAKYGLTVIACFGGAPHKIAGEHPLGLALDAAPRDGDWRRTEQLARDAGWGPSCAANGCAGRGPFRVVLYNGYPGHGDPQHSRTPHLHLSWQHGAAPPFTPAPWVRTLLPPSGTSR